MKIAFLPLAALLFLLAACDGTRQQLVGKWSVQGANNPVVWEFSKNGVARTGNIAGKYTLGDNHRLKIQTPSATFVYTLKISGDTMTWQDMNGSRTEFKRIE